jgi:hypothetical protein
VIKINEVESNDGSPGDWVELFNTSAVAVDISGLKFLDNDNTHTKYTIPPGTVLASGGFFVLEEAQFGFGLGSADSAQLFAVDGTTVIDAFSWTDHAITTYGRCPNGTGSFATTAFPTKGASNACPNGSAPIAAWPGEAPGKNLPPWRTSTEPISWPPKRSVP